jgi:hypothetical protein
MGYEWTWSLLRKTDRFGVLAATDSRKSMVAEAVVNLTGGLHLRKERAFLGPL